MKLVVGLGNPGKEYENTRHNVGFIIIDNYLKDVNWKKNTDSFEYMKNIDGEKVIFLKPLTFMNLSGLAVGRIAKYYKINPEDILIIHDDLDLPSCTYRFKTNSSSGGHNGIKSIIDNLGTNSFCRLKIGIGNNKSINTKDFVLSKLSKNEIEDLKSEKYIELINYFLKNGIEKTMNKYN